MILVSYRWKSPENCHFLCEQGKLSPVTKLVNHPKMSRLYSNPFHQLSFYFNFCVLWFMCLPLLLYIILNLMNRILIIMMPIAYFVIMIIINTIEYPIFNYEWKAKQYHNLVIWSKTKRKLTTIRSSVNTTARQVYYPLLHSNYWNLRHLSKYEHYKILSKFMSTRYKEIDNLYT